MSLDTRVWAGVDGVMPKEWVDSTHTLEGLDGEEGAGRWLRDAQGPMEVAEVASPPLPIQEPIHVCSPAPLRPRSAKSSWDRHALSTALPWGQLR